MVLQKRPSIQIIFSRREGRSLFGTKIVRSKCKDGLTTEYKSNVPDKISARIRLTSLKGVARLWADSFAQNLIIIVKFRSYQRVELITIIVRLVGVDLLLTDNLDKLCC